MKSNSNVYFPKKTGFPFVVECNLDDRSTQFWEATRLGQLFGDTVAEVKNINTNEKEKDFPLKVRLRIYWSGVP